ncbi:MAG: threonine aldolase family protein [Pseudomonadota bacterium]
MIDLRSDTCSRPTAEMRTAMAEAEVGDDVYGDDPTVKALEVRTAELLGKEDAVYMPTGTMTNQVALRCQTEPGDVILLHEQAHIHETEGAASSVLSGILPKFLPGSRGIFASGDVEACLTPGHRFAPSPMSGPVRMVCLENTHNVGGGAVWPLEDIQAVAQVTRFHETALHLDGARLWHATTATGITEAEYAASFDTISVCFSKGLGAPVGSCLVGSKELMGRARRFKQQFGGGFRQAGIIAAGALHALEHHRPRLQETHDNAKRFAEGLAELPQIEIDPASVETNIVRFQLTDIEAGEFVEEAYRRGIHMLPSGRDGVRVVFYLDIQARQVDEALSIIKESLKALV